MSALDINKGDEDEIKTPDKQQIEAEEKEVMLKTDSEVIVLETTEKAESEGPVKSALSGDVTEEGREVKPKFIPIGAIKMPGFFTRNTEKEKSKVPYKHKCICKKHFVSIEIFIPKHLHCACV